MKTHQSMPFVEVCFTIRDGKKSPSCISCCLHSNRLSIKFYIMHVYHSDLRRIMTDNLVQPEILSAGELHKFVHNFISLSDEEVEFSGSINVLNEFIQSLSSNTLNVFKYNTKIFRYSDDLNLADLNDDLSAIVTLVKASGPVLKSKSIGEQINVINIPVQFFEEGRNRNEAIESVRSMINLGMSPYFDLIASKMEENSNSVNITRKKFNELSLSLQHMQQKIQIPNLLNTVHPKVLEITTNNLEIDSGSIEDSVFLNELTHIVNGWIKQIQQITSLNHEPLDGASIVDELQFWKSMESALDSIEKQTQTKEVLTSIEILNKAKRFHVTLSFNNDTGLNNKINTTRLYNSLLKDIPINEMMIISWGDKNCMIKLEEAIINLFNHVKKIKNLNTFPLPRALNITEVILSDIIGKICNTLTNSSLLSIPLDDFSHIYNDQIKSIFETIDQNVKYMVNLVRELLRKRQEKFMVIKINHALLDEFKERMQYLYDFRVKHEQLLVSLEQLLSLEYRNELTDSYKKYIATLNPFELTRQSKTLWENNEKHYLIVYKKMENMLFEKLNSIFGACHNLNDYISVFKKYDTVNDQQEEYNARLTLLISDEHKMRIMSIINDELEDFSNLTTKRSHFQKAFCFVDSNKQTGINQDQSNHFHQMIFNINFKNRLLFFRETLDYLLGQTWNKYAIGSQIDSKMDTLLQNLSSSKLFDNWLDTMKIDIGDDKDTLFMGPLLKAIHSDKLDLIVNFDFRLLNTVHEMKALSDLGFKIPIYLSIKINKIDKVYSLVVNLYQQVDILKRICDENYSSQDYLQTYGFMIDRKKTETFQALRTLLDVKWNTLSKALDLQRLDAKEKNTESHSLVEFEAMSKIKNFETNVFHLHKQVIKVKEFDQFLRMTYISINNTPCDRKRLNELVNLIHQEMIALKQDNHDHFDLLSEKVESELSCILIERCKDYLEMLNTFVNNGDPQHLSDALVLEARDFFSQKKHYIVLEEQRFQFVPPLESTKFKFTCTINEIISVFTSDFDDFKINFRGLRKETNEKSEHINTTITQLFFNFDELISKCNSYLNEWKKLQILWESTSNGNLSEIVPSDADLDEWKNIITDVLKSRKLFESQDTIRLSFFSIDCSRVRSAVTFKYDAFQVALIDEFSRKYQEECKNLLSSLKRSREVLEPKLSLESNSWDFIRSIESYCQVKEFLHPWKLAVSKYRDYQMFLIRLRHKFFEEWVYVEQLENELSILISLLEHKSSKLEDNVEVISSKIKSFNMKLSEEMSSRKKEWAMKKPVQGNIRPAQALIVINDIRNSFQALNERRFSILRIQDVFNYSLEPIVPANHEIAEIEELRLVWSSLNSVWEDLEGIKAIPWQDLQHRKLRHQLEELLNHLKSFPIKVKQYVAFDEIQSTIKSYVACLPFISDLKSDAIKPRHWKRLMSELGTQNNHNTLLTLGDVLCMNLSVNGQLIKFVVDRANNEKLIEDNIIQIKKDWKLTTFEIFNYKDRCRLVKNWEALIEKCDNDISMMKSMKSSPYYSSFENEVLELETRLQNLYSIFDSWIDVQRQWIYLEGIFGTKSSELRTLLPLEHTRFTNITYEFMDLLQRVYKYETVCDILNLQDTQDILKKCNEGLVKTRKSLSNYLEKQRDLFPRFYFVGNEDLLELIGGSNDIERINKHIRKMYTGIATVDYNDENCTIEAINSEQGEKLRLNNPISLIKFHSLIDWLIELEQEIKDTLNHCLKVAMNEYSIQKLILKDANVSILQTAVENLPSQILVLGFQIAFTSNIESIISNPSLEKLKYEELLVKYESIIQALTYIIGLELTTVVRKKVENMIIEILHHRNILSDICEAQDQTQINHIWHLQMRFYYNPNEVDVNKSINIQHSTYETNYGFEYLGVLEKLAYTPLTNECFLAMSLALNQKHGGSPFGPAGTGKTETIKALGNNLGKMVLVFCCDNSFDFWSMGRIFLGLCRVGCWGCFDEFNRLDAKILSAVSSQIEKIEFGLNHSERKIEISGKHINVDDRTGIFVTMNPGYVGRSELPENLKKLFRAFSMDKPNIDNIVEILLTSQTFKHAKELTSLVVPFFDDLREVSSPQAHYDFGLRAIKSTLVKCGSIKRSLPGEQTSILDSELSILLQSIKETVAPKLIRSDLEHFKDLVGKHFSNVSGNQMDYSRFESKFKDSLIGQGLKPSNDFVSKALQLFQIQETHHGIMLVGESGSGKTTIWKNALKTISTIHDQDFLFYVLDCKVMKKANIYGHLDNITREWTDGVFTSLLRKIKSNLRGELSKRIWIVFDGDIDPEWAENLNSVLDDNKLFTLPNGERLDIPENIRFLFEVDSLKFTTPATISRCGMIWFDKSLVQNEMLIDKTFKNISDHLSLQTELNFSNSPFAIELQERIFHKVRSNLDKKTIYHVHKMAQDYDHIMFFTFERCLSSFITIFSGYMRRYVQYIKSTGSMEVEIEDKILKKVILLSLSWAFMGDASLSQREKFCTTIFELDLFTQLEKPEGDELIMNFDISLTDGCWKYWGSVVEEVELGPHQILQPNTVIPTLDTILHENLIYSILNEHKHLILCGPPGSGKTMTLLEALGKSPQLDIVPLNFSKDTSPNSLIKSLEQYCEYSVSPTGSILKPKNQGKWVVVFCDEINLPSKDKYDTQKVISLIRQMIEHGGFWRESSCEWISLNSIQFVGACNPPTDPGRHTLSNRFLRHVSVLMIDYPGTSSLHRIYSTILDAIMKCAPDLRGFSDVITQSMIHVYTQTKEKLTSDIEKHYIYSPRELSRWTGGLFEVLRKSEYHDLSSFVRLWYHEGLRLFYDRLVGDSERTWTIDLFKSTIGNYFPNIDIEKTLKGPVLFSNWLTQSYESVDSNELYSFVKERLKVFSDEEYELDLVLYEDLLDYSLRVDRVLRQSQGHMILVGPCTSGKTTIVRFVAWINGLKLLQLSVTSSYRLQDFDDTLRDTLLKCAKGEKICFLIDEANILETAFVERMNTLLANSEIPGLFEGDHKQALLNICSDQSNTQGLVLDSEDELLGWFSSQISQNLHVVFSISETDNSNNPEVLSSPALFNRCVLSWMGDWSDRSLISIGSTLVEEVPLDASEYTVPNDFESNIEHQISGLKDVIVHTFIYVHRRFAVFRTEGNVKGIPGDFMSLFDHFIKIFETKNEEVEESQRHIISGLDKLREAVIQVNQLNKELSSKKEFLTEKNNQARVMLNQMLSEQNEAERKQEFSIVTQGELEKQEKEIDRRKALVMKDLSLAEPAVLEAQRGVQNIKKQHLTELRSMMNPPNAVKMTMESVCILLGYKVTTWRDVQLIIRRDDFIANIVSFSNEGQLTPELMDYMHKTYVIREDYNFEAVNRASKACGPLLQWVLAQLNYSTILGKIEPLRKEVASLEAQTKKTKAQLIAIDQMIKELQESIERYKDDYSSLIRDAENTKSEMKNVENKINRSMSLIDNLTTERERWKVSTQEFKKKKNQNIGNSILASVFLVFCGGYDQKKRMEIVDTTKQKLDEAAIEFDNDILFYTFLNRPNEALKWRAVNGENDQLVYENITLIQKSRFPLIIDPSSKFIDILSYMIPSQNLTITSFLSNGYLKHLENSMRFGGCVLIQDAEFYDPILNNLLRYNIHRNAGRMTIKLGEMDVDLSPDFKLFLHVKDSKLRVPSFVASRTSCVNFTITEGSLESEVLNIILRKIRPDIEAKRSESIALQSEYSHILFNLEDDLLRLLSDSNGNILENDSLLKTLERLKAESTEIDIKMSNCKDVMKEVTEVRSQYDELATHSSGIFRFIKNINRLNKFYTFSVEYFMSILKAIMDNVIEGQIDKMVLIGKLYEEVYSRIVFSLSLKDRIIFSLLMFVSFHQSINESFFLQSFIILLKLIQNDQALSLSSYLDLVLARYNKSSTTDELNFDILINENQDNQNLTAQSDFLNLVMSPTLESDTLIPTFSKTCSRFFTGVESWSSKYDLSNWLDDSFATTSLLILVSSEGFDATTKVERLCSSLNKKLTVLSMGSTEGGDTANRELELAASNGDYILLQNVQMSPQWLSFLDLKLESLSVNQGFRLFLTCSMTSDIPPSLLHRGNIFIFESSTGLRNTVRETLKSIPSKVFEDSPSELLKVMFMIVWFHSIILERLKFCPISFSKQYDINDSDFHASLFIVEGIFQHLNSKGKIDPSKIPWSQLAYLIGRITYGGKIENKDDLNFMINLAKYLLSVDIFDADFNLIRNDLTEKLKLSVTPPKDMHLASLMAWVDKLPEDAPLCWIGLEEEVHDIIRRKQGLQVTQDLVNLLEQ